MSWTGETTSHSFGMRHKDICSLLKLLKEMVQRSASPPTRGAPNHPMSQMVRLNASLGPAEWEKLSEKMVEFLRMAVSDRAHKRLCANCGSSTSLRACSACKSIFYCSSACQRQDWKAHKAQCRQQALKRADNKEEKHAAAQG